MPSGKVLGQDLAYCAALCPVTRRLDETWHKLRWSCRRCWAGGVATRLAALPAKLLPALDHAANIIYIRFDRYPPLHVDPYSLVVLNVLLQLPDTGLD